jgi:perosamine synthetase
MCDVDSLKALLLPRGIALIEDAAEAFGSSWRNQLAGAAATLGTYSFHATKTITTGEGGMVVTDDPKLFEQMQLYRSHGMARNVRYYWHEVAGHNFRLTNFQAAMGCAQFAHFAEIKKSRVHLHRQYRQHLQFESGIALQTFDENVAPVLWALAIRLDPTAFPQGRDEVILEMGERGIECRPGFYAASQQPLYNAAPLPVCEGLAQQVLSLPCFVGLEEDQVDYICASLLALRQPRSTRMSVTARRDHAIH